MGMMTFLLPDGMQPEALQALARGYVFSGPEQTPWPTRIDFGEGFLLATRDADESGAMCVPWVVEGRSAMLSTATLMERTIPYHLAVELARGRVNLLRAQLNEWRNGGLTVPAEFDARMHEINHAFARMVCCQDRAAEVNTLAADTLALTIRAGEQLVKHYVDQVLDARLSRQSRLDTLLGFGLAAAPPSPGVAQSLRAAANCVRLNLPWPSIEPEEGEYHWDATDAAVRWAKENGFILLGGPLIDFSQRALPGWLWLYEDNPDEIAILMSRFLTAAVQRYRGDIRSWQIVAGANSSQLLSLNEETNLHLTAALLDQFRRIDPQLEAYVGLSQPWGEYLTQKGRSYSSLNFADTLLRSGLRIVGFDIEIVQGVTPRGSLVRERLDISRMLDLHATILGTPLRVTLTCPAATERDPLGDASLSVETAQNWSVETQRGWAADLLPLAIAKPYVSGVFWAHAADALPHVFPHGGLAAADHGVRPVVDELSNVRQRWLR